MPSIPAYVFPRNYANGLQWEQVDMDAVGDSLEAYLNAELTPSLPANAEELIGFRITTTTNSNDTLKLTSNDATPLATGTNEVEINLPHATTNGRTTKFSLTADLTLKLVGHWGGGGFGDVVNTCFRFGLINDGSATPALALFLLGNRKEIASTDCFTAAGSLTEAKFVLVNRALNVGTWPLTELGYAKADFTDATDVWAFDSSELFPFIQPEGVWMNYKRTITGFSSLTSSQTDWCQVGNSFFVRYSIGGTSNASTFEFGLPFAPQHNFNLHFPVWYSDNSAVSATFGSANISALTTVSLFRDPTGLAWTASGGKSSTGILPALNFNTL